jgi:hypothetical protein
VGRAPAGARSRAGDESERGTGIGVGPGGFEPPYPDPKSGVLPLDEGPAMSLALNLRTANIQWKALTLPCVAAREALGHRPRRNRLRRCCRNARTRAPAPGRVAARSPRRDTPAREVQGGPSTQIVDQPSRETITPAGPLRYRAHCADPERVGVNVDRARRERRVVFCRLGYSLVPQFTMFTASVPLKRRPASVRPVNVA